MPADGHADIPAIGRTGILIVCPSDAYALVKSHVSHHADPQWEQKQDIIVVSIPRAKLRDGLFVTSEINRAASRSNCDLRMLTVDAIVFDPARVRGQVLISPADQNLTPNTFARSRLPNALKGLRLDWRASVADSLANAWDHGNVDETRIENWLRQFDQLESHGWVGERLLRVLDFWSSARIRRSLALTDKVIEGYSHVCVNRQQAGKSADPLANKIQKMLNEFTSLKVADLSEILGKDGTASLLYIEDCLLTGTEITKLFASLLGRVPPGRTPKVPPLRDQALLTQKRIVMKFLVTTNLGREILTRFLAENGLANVEIDVGQGDVTTLTPAGIQALRDGTSVITSKPAIHNHLKTGQRGLTQD